MNGLAVVLTTVVAVGAQEPWWRAVLPYVGTVLGLVFGLAASPLQERWARQREERAEDRAKTQRQEEAKAEREREARETAAALVTRHRLESRAIVSSLTELARTIREALDEDKRYAEQLGTWPTTPTSRDGMRGAMREVEGRCWDLLLDCPPGLAKITAEAIAETRDVFRAGLQGVSRVYGQETSDVADVLSRDFGDACRVYFTTDEAPRLGTGAGPSAPFLVVAPLD